jgi:hypothetical protein
MTLMSGVVSIGLDLKSNGLDFRAFLGQLLSFSVSLIWITDE